MSNNNLQKGFTILPRSFYESLVWLEPRTFSKAECWIDLVSMAKFEPCSQIIGYRTINLNRGEFIASSRFLQNRWGFSLGKTKNILKFFEDNNQIDRKVVHKITVIKLINYDKYQKIE